MRSSSRLFDRRERGLDLGQDRGLALGTARSADFEARIEPQRGTARRSPCERSRMLAQRRPHVVLRNGTRICRRKRDQRADQRDVAPGSPPASTSALKPSFSATPRITAMKQASSAPSASRSIAAAVGALERHVVQPDRRGRRRRDLVGALVHHRSPCSPAPARARKAESAGRAPDLEADALAVVAGAAVEVDGERPLLRQALDHADVADRVRGE
jgi:hypothetical protein